MSNHGIQVQGRKAPGAKFHGWRIWWRPGLSSPPDGICLRWAADSQVCARESHWQAHWGFLDPWRWIEQLFAGKPPGQTIRLGEKSAGKVFIYQQAPLASGWERFPQVGFLLQVFVRRKPIIGPPPNLFKYSPLPITVLSSREALYKEFFCFYLPLVHFNPEQAALMLRSIVYLASFKIWTWSLHGLQASFCGVVKVWEIEGINNSYRQEELANAAEDKKKLCQWFIERSGQVSHPCSLDYRFRKLASLLPCQHYQAPVCEAFARQVQCSVHKLDYRLDLLKAVKHWQLNLKYCNKGLSLPYMSYRQKAEWPLAIPIHTDCAWKCHARRCFLCRWISMTSEMLTMLKRPMPMRP